ncbi:MAG: hypothetical protein FWD80_05900, partial [Propionibacteriaceae bacterium]|nr:hypothetical protein [Propionibacteriaceae bacterium]
ASAVALAAQFTQLPLSHTDGTMTSCPMDDGAFTVVAFAFGDRLDFDLWVKTNGCATVANGFILTENIGVAIP